jgi:hypothetical protein
MIERRGDPAIQIGTVEQDTGSGGCRHQPQPDGDAAMQAVTHAVDGGFQRVSGHAWSFEAAKTGPVTQ